MDNEKVKSFALSLLVSLTAVCLVLLCLEAGLRILDPLKRNTRAVPGGTADGKNSFRQRIPQGPKAPGEIRILTLGDSYTWGDGIDDTRRTWPALLEKDLGQRYPDKRFSVTNLGVCGFTTMNELETLVKVGQDLSPDLVIVQFLVNDILPSGSGLKRVGEDWLYTRRPVDLIPDQRLNRFVTGVSYLYAFVNERYQALQRKLWPPRSWRELYADSSDYWGKYRKVLAALGYWQDQKKVPVVFILFPTFQRGVMTEQNFVHREIYAKVADAARSCGLAVYQLMPAFAGEKQDGRTWMVSMSDGHPNELAHSLVAGWVGRYLAESRLVD